MSRKFHANLSIMMFLEFFVWGAWYVTVGIYMTSVGMTDAIYWAYTVSPIGAMISPFFLGMIADRFFATEKVLGVLHLIGGAAMLMAAKVAGGGAAAAPLFITFLLIHMICYMPTISLTNALAFHHVSSQEKEFPLIRVFGTLGWIVAGILVSAVLHADETVLPLQIAGMAGIVMGLYSFSLPHTPPPAKGETITVRQILGLDALAQLKSRSFIVFIVSSLLISIPLAAYYAYAPVFVSAAGVVDPAFKMSFGQMSEVLFMLAMPLLFVRLGVKWMLIIGMGAWALRYALFAAAAVNGVMWMIMLGILLHGICYDFFFVSGHIYVDKKATPAIRGQAQGLIIFVTYGVGMFIGAQVSGWVFNAVVGESAKVLGLWQQFWIIPAVFAVAVIVMFGLLFNDKLPAGEAEPVSET